MFDFILIENKRIILPKSVRRRFSSRHSQWLKRKDIPHLIVLMKMIYAAVFVCMTIFICLYHSNDHTIRIWDIWYSFVALILILSLFNDQLKCGDMIPMRIIDSINILLFTIFIILLFIGHVKTYFHLWHPTTLSIELTRLTFVSIVLIDICPISIAIKRIFNLLRKHRSFRRIHPTFITSNV